MLKNITLDRPLAVLDLETTGTDTKIDRWRPDIGRSSTPAQTKGDT